MLLIQRAFILLRERLALFWKDSHGRVFPVEVLNRVTNGLNTSVYLAGNLSNDFGQIVALCGQSSGSINDLVPFYIRHLAKTFTALDPMSVLGDESLDARVEESDSLAALGDKSPGHQTLFPPSRNGLGRDVESLAQVLDGMHRFGGFFEAQVHRIGDVFDEKPQIVRCVLAPNQTHRMNVRADLGDSIEQEIERVFLGRIQFRQELLGPVGLLATLVAWGKTNLLISQLPNQCNLVIAIHPLLASCHANSTGTSIKPILRCWLNGTSSIRWNQTISLYPFDAMETDLVRQFDRLGDEKN
jgi:hypothetical protein